ncbi:hypothetical protein NPIL_693531 [Nephila pilipes]|uniref:Uncharacterized protein n=1 Tax=Nephila pilipes TaxID=299642 RepID=A0A8X6MXY3_NEPPI|nr:hypothetical protein NPIL_693531 [Nephila pilipes]
MLVGHRDFPNSTLGYSPNSALKTFRNKPVTLEQLRKNIRDVKALKRGRAKCIRKSLDAMIFSPCDQGLLNGNPRCLFRDTLISDRSRSVSISATPPSPTGDANWKSSPTPGLDHMEKFATKAPAIFKELSITEGQRRCSNSHTRAVKQASHLWRLELQTFSKIPDVSWISLSATENVFKQVFDNLSGIVVYQSYDMPLEEVVKSWIEVEQKEKKSAKSCKRAQETKEKGEVSSSFFTLMADFEEEDPNLDHCLDSGQFLLLSPAVHPCERVIRQECRAGSWNVGDQRVKNIKTELVTRN